MPDSVTCFACGREPTHQCPRCGRPYCDEHGEDVCDACLHPGSGVPSFTLYRGSLLALLIGTAIAVWLIVQPSGGESSAALKPAVLSPTPVLRSGAATTPGATSTLVANQTPGAGGTATAAAGATTAAGTPRPATTAVAGTATTPAAGATPGAATTPATAPGSGTTSYTVASGDTISSICTAQKPATMAISDCIDRVQSLNKLTSQSTISVGQSLTIPQ